jgi:hypothetical protein
VCGHFKQPQLQFGNYIFQKGNSNSAIILTQKHIRVIKSFIGKIQNPKTFIFVNSLELGSAKLSKFNPSFHSSSKTKALINVNKCGQKLLVSSFDRAQLFMNF